MCGLTHSKGIRNSNRARNIKGNNTQVVLGWMQQKGNQAGANWEARAPRKHSRFTLKQADPLVSDSQMWPTAHRLSRGKCRAQGTRLRLIRKEGNQVSSRGSPSSDLPDSPEHAWPEPEPAQECDRFLWLGQREGLPHRGQGGTADSGGNPSLLLGASRVSCCGAPLPPSSLSPAAAQIQGLTGAGGQGHLGA